MAPALTSSAPQLTEEPPVRCYLRSDCAGPDERGRVLAAAATSFRGILRLAT